MPTLLQSKNVSLLLCLDTDDTKFGIKAQEYLIADFLVTPRESEKRGMTEGEKEREKEGDLLGYQTLLCYNFL